jgi:hypothetical protein
MHWEKHAYLQFACSESLRSDLGCTVAAVVSVVGAEWWLLVTVVVVVVVVVVVAAAAAAAAVVVVVVVASVEQVVEMYDDSVSVVAVVVTGVADAAAADDAAVDADVLVVDKHTGSVESCQFRCYPGSRPTENTSRRTYIKQLILVVNSVTYPS